MSSNNASTPRRRRPKKVLSPSAKYEIWLRLVRGEATIAQVAPAAGYATFLLQERGPRGGQDES